ncbi:hypothetical protein ASG01_10980 [Chryseobacterium sp. Leaf180]|uniref:hypothetical protein n=1 Tax=Chryseobacterium sp. Leaf180 TaxID=1736289 RepID=UPI0006F50161|nr:hypothetical protein [Chryseobacterium sp. Leaf180]KQR92438.1 hypothetical protein ASG01_10980 [Chryseobacterium sp. Leaf180]
MKDILKLFVVVNLLHSCAKNEQSIFSKFKDDFYSAAKNTGAEKFEYQFDGLMPQTSFFVGCQLKFLSIKSHGELTSTESLIYFEDDSISEIIEHIEIFEGNDGGETAGRSGKLESDSVIINDFQSRTKKSFLNSKLVTSGKLKKKAFTEYIYTVKKCTEKQFKCVP